MIDENNWNFLTRYCQVIPIISIKLLSQLIIKVKIQYKYKEVSFTPMLLFSVTVGFYFSVDFSECYSNKSIFLKFILFNFILWFICNNFRQFSFFEIFFNLPVLSTIDIWKMFEIYFWKFHLWISDRTRET